MGGPGKDVGEVHPVAVGACVAGRGQVVRKGVGVGVVEHGKAYGVPGIIHVVQRSSVADGSAEIVFVFAVATIALAIFFVLIVAWDGSNDLELPREDHGETVTTDWFFDAGEGCTVSPFVEFAAEGVRFKFYETELTGCEEAMAPGSVDVSDRRVYNGGF